MEHPGHHERCEHAKLVNGRVPWKLGFRSSRKFVISVVAMAIFTVCSSGAYLVVTAS